MGGPADSEGDAVEVMTMPQVLESTEVESSIDLLKCDIEGAESQVLADCAGWIGRVRNLVIELHAPYTREAFLAD